MTVPSWAADAIFYQIFPDRFYNGDLSNDPPTLLPWDACAVPRGFHGGDLRGITERLDYLQDLGVNAIYLNPIFQSPSNHRYNTTDYYRIDPILGGLLDYRQMVDAMHARGMRVILDGVFNHTGRGFFAFDNILENGEYSPYLDWYHIKGFPLDAYTHGEAKNYVAWWGFKSLPKLNTDNPKVREYILGVARYWIDQGADGWRLDVPNEIDDDAFWAEFRQVVRQANPEALLIGEIWDAIPRWVNDTHFDGLMDYPFRTAIIGLLTGHWKPVQFGKFIDALMAAYPWEHNLAMYVLLGSHDVERILTMLGGNVEKAKLAALIQFAYPGMPAIYYGDEVGMTGGKDPDCRGGFPWEEQYWNKDLRAWFQKLIAQRKAVPALRYGAFQSIQASDSPALYAFARKHEQGSVLVVLNPSGKKINVDLPVADLGWADGRLLRCLLTGKESVVSRDHVSLDLSAWSGVWLA